MSSLEQPCHQIVLISCVNLVDESVDLMAPLFVFLVAGVGFVARILGSLNHAVIVVASLCFPLLKERREHKEEERQKIGERKKEERRKKRRKKKERRKKKDGKKEDGRRKKQEKKKKERKKEEEEEEELQTFPISV